jgi:hypothetical protein
MMASGTGVTDPYFAFVTSLLHFDGSNGSTTITDQISANTWTCHGGAALSTTQSKFGPTSLHCTSFGDFLTAAASANFAFGTSTSVPFTLEGWFYRTSTAGGNECLLNLRDVPSSSGIALYNSTIATSANCCVNDLFGNVLVGGSAGNNQLFNIWCHWALCFDVTPSPMLYLYINGVISGSSSYNPSWAATPIPFLGDNISAPSQPNPGYYDEMRFTKGVNRYPGGTTFTPPSAPFPNS